MVLKHANNNNLTLIRLLFLTSIVTFLSCQKQQDVDIVSQTDLYDLMECAGFKTQNIVDDGDYLVVEGDMVMKKQDLLTILEKENKALNGSNKTDAYVLDASGVVTNSNTSNINYYVHPTVYSLPAFGAWLTAIENATTAWSSIPNCRITFVQTTIPSSANITIYGVDMPGDNNIQEVAELPSCATNQNTTNLGMSTYPVNSNVGKWVVIPAHTATYPYSYAAGERTNIIAHELGHALGFRHSDAGANCGAGGEPAYGSGSECALANGLNHIFNTPDCDATSLMHYTNDNTFNDDDKEAACMLYPKLGAGGVAISSIVPVFCGHHCRNWLATIANTLPWYQIRLQLRNSAGQTVKSSNWVLGNNPTLSLSYGFAGTYTLLVQGKNYKGDVITNSGGVTVVVP